MKLFLILAVGCVAVTTFTIDQDKSRIHGKNGWYVPHANGSFYWMDEKEAEPLLKVGRSAQLLDVSLTPVSFYLYTRSNPTKGKQLTDSVKTVQNSNFNPSYPTRIVIHGFTQGYTSHTNKVIRDAWLRKGFYNVIVVDWARARSVDYVSSVKAVPKVGEKVAAFIDMMYKYHEMGLDDLCIIGHSLGAHVAGFAGKFVKSGQVHTIIGLDPALPLYSYNKPSKRLNSEDAYYVETIQTDGNVYGFLEPIGKSAFYPNGGKSQPGCLTNVCSHERSVDYYAECVAKDDFAAISCENLEDAVSKNCGDTFSSIRMGADENAYMVAGIFNVPVNRKPPYGVLS